MFFFPFYYMQTEQEDNASKQDSVPGLDSKPEAFSSWTPDLSYGKYVHIVYM